MSSINPTKAISKNSRGIAIFIIMCIGHFIVDFSLGLWPVWKTIAHYPLVQAGLASGVAVFIGEGTQAIFSLWADRGYFRPLIVIGIIIASTTLLFPLSHSIIGAGVLLFCSCLGSSAFHPTSVGFVSSLPIASKSVLIAIFHMCGLLGLAISQISFMALYEKGPLVPLFFLLLPLLISPIFLALKSSPELMPHQEKERANLSVFWKFLKKEELRKVYLLLFANQTMSWALLFLLPDFLLEKGSSESFSFGIGHCIYISGAASACIPLGILANRLDAALIIFITYVVSIGAFFFTIIAPPASLALNSALFILGGSMGAVPPLALAIGNELEPKNRSMISAFLMGFVWIFSDGTGYMLSAYLASHFSENPSTFGLALMGSFLLFGMIQSFFLWRRFTRKSIPLET